MYTVPDDAGQERESDIDRHCGATPTSASLTTRTTSTCDAAAARPAQNMHPFAATLFVSVSASASAFVLPRGVRPRNGRPISAAAPNGIRAGANEDIGSIDRVAVIGSGISGLSLAIALRSLGGLGGDTGKPPMEIDIFDSRNTLDEKAGSGIQVTGGLSALRKIDKDLQKEVCESALPLRRVESKCSPWVNWFGEDGWKILELDVQKAIRDLALSEDDCGLVTEDGEVLAYTILRGTLQRIMLDRLQREHGIEVQFGKKLSGISFEESESEGISCQFADGSRSGSYDLVVGCDGIQSKVKEYVERGKIESDGLASQSSIYSGLRITFAIQENVKEDIKECQFTQHFGDNAYALTSAYGAGKEARAKGAFLVYPDPDYIGPFPRRRGEDSDRPDANADWTQDNRISKDHVKECLDVLGSARVAGNDVASIIEQSDRFFDLGVYFHSPFSLSGWSREVPRTPSKGLFAGPDSKTGKFVVVAGDAAHAMPPFLGQGANQALQDSYTLASKIHAYNCNVKTDTGADVRTSLKEYEQLRWLPTTSITIKAALLGYLEVGPSLLSKFRDVFFYVMGKAGVAKKVFLSSANPKM
ncbi:hypothetical protein THAOC_05418 [Thalassiosira oceanica]|uniref:FAD-binding domain-containing protein n=1 Tax=Thalassiosira oceanica TaxID=159749 RepID=K0T5N5_THAOC|nr:hypothetical protein THAOC_05418 [Thalassiosira oceanica]|eukprot:EJK72990.1 hypothetical protein THAOC_05418 [Thalassiosira oceanica]